MKSILSLPLILLIVCTCKSNLENKPQIPFKVQTIIGEEGETVILGAMNRANLNTKEFLTWCKPTYESQIISKIPLKLITCPSSPARIILSASCTES